MKKFLVILAMSVSSCAGLKKLEKPLIVTEKSYSIQFDNVWSSVIEFVTNNGMSPKTLDKSSGLVIFEKSTDNDFMKNYFVCESAGILNTFANPLSLNFFIKQSQKNVIVKINLTGSSYATFNGVDKIQKSCYSNGKFEQEVFNNIK